MKKFMKAIAFATVMCMLLSVAAFAASNAEIATAGTVNIIVEGATASTPIAFVVTDTTVTEAANITSANIKDVAQTETTASGTASIALGTGGLDTVNVFYGYEGATLNGEPSALMLSAALEVEVYDTVVIKNLDIITEQEISEYIASNPGAAIAATDTDNATALVFEIDIDANGKTVTDMIWSIRHSGANRVAYVDADTDIFTVLDGTVKYALAFSNGNRTEGGIAEVTIEGLEAIVKLSDGSEIFSEEEPFDQLAEQKQQPAESEEN